MVRRSTFIVLLIFAFLVGFAILFQRYQANKTANLATVTPTVAPVYLFSLGDAQIDDIKIVGNSGKKIDLYRDPLTSKWAITDISPDQADSSKIDSISSQLRSMQIQETITQTVPPATIGLETPSYTITLTTSLGTQFVSSVGIKTAIGSGYYIRDTNGKVAIVATTPLDSILQLVDSPPLLPTATPEATLTETIVPVVPTSQATPTP
jgi:Domain of unknown function (DUF4340)